MKNITISDYESHNLFNHVVFHPEMVEETISQFRLRFSRTRNDRIEWGVALPAFVKAFYTYLYQYNAIPTQEDFICKYFTKYRQTLANFKFNGEEIEALEARLKRTYPSIMRDFHFAMVLHHSGQFEKVIYNTDLDLQEGIDILIVQDGLYFGVNLFTDTRNANHGRIVKVNRHTPFDNVIPIDLPVTLDDNTACGSFYLYGQKELRDLNYMINQRKNHGN